MLTNVQAKFRQLAGATVPCSAAPGCEGQLGEDGLVLEPHPFCHGTGRVYLFGDEVRVPCPGEQMDDNELRVELRCISGKLSMNGQVHAPHNRCQGTGWVPSEDGWVWGPVIKEALYKQMGKYAGVTVTLSLIAKGWLIGQDAVMGGVTQVLQAMEEVQLG